MTEQQACTLCGAGGHAVAQCPWNAPGVLESIRLPKHGTTFALDEVLSNYLPHDREGVREAIEAYADIQARKAVMLFSGAGLAGQPSQTPELAMQATDGGRNPLYDGLFEGETEEQRHDRIVGALRAEVEDADGLSKRLGELLSEIAIAIRGPEPALTRYGYADLPLRIKTLVEERAAAPAGQVPQAWIDVQAERRRQIDEEGWPAVDDDQNKPGELAQAAAAYLLYAVPRGISDLKFASRLWPWISGFKPQGSRNDLVRGIALGLAAIERFDRAAAPVQGGE